jgi:uncharacterized protein (TIRG00374 family)
METRAESPITLFQTLRYVLPLIILGLAVHLLIPQLTSLESSFKVLQQMAPWAVILAVIAQVISYLGAGYLLKSIVDLSGHSFSTLKATMIVMAAASLGMVAGGMVGSAAATYRWIQKEGAKPEAAGLAGTIPGFFNSSVLVLVSLVGLVHLLILHQLSQLQAISFAIIFILLFALAGIFIWGFRHQHRIIELVHRFSAWYAGFRHKEYHPAKTDGWLVRLFDAWALLVKGGWREPVIGAVINVLFDMLTLYFLFIAAGHPVSPGILLTGYGLPLIFGRMAFIFPGGVGVIEGTMVALYDSLGVPDPITVVVVLSYRILSFWMPLILGFPMILVLQRKNNK